MYESTFVNTPSFWYGLNRPACSGGANTSPAENATAASSATIPTRRRRGDIPASLSAAPARHPKRNAQLRRSSRKSYRVTYRHVTHCLLWPWGEWIINELVYRGRVLGQFVGTPQTHQQVFHGLPTTTTTCWGLPGGRTQDVVFFRQIA